VFIDISSCIASGLKQFVDSADDADKEIRAVVNDFLLSNVRIIERQNNKRIEISYATCLTVLLPIWGKDLIMHTAATTAVQAGEDLDDMKYEKLQMVLRNFDNTFTRLFMN